MFVTDTGVKDRWHFSELSKAVTEYLFDNISSAHKLNEIEIHAVFQTRVEIFGCCLFAGSNSPAES